MAKKKKSNGLLGAGSIPKQIRVKAPKPKKQSDVNWRKVYYGGSEAKQKKIAKKVRRSKELEIFRGEVAPITSSKGDSKRTKKYAARQQRLFKQGKNAREILRFDVGDRGLNLFFDIKSYNVREAQRSGLEQQLKQVEKAIKEQQSRIKKNGGEIAEIPEANFQALKLGTYTDAKKFQSQPLILRELQATRTQIKKEITRLEARTLMGRQTVMRRRKRKALRNNNNKAAKGYQQKINKLKKKEDKKRKDVRKLNEQFDEQESKLQQIQASKILQVANKATNMSKKAVLEEAQKTGKINSKLIEAAKNNDSLFQQVLNEMPKNSAAVKTYNKRKLAEERTKTIAEDSGLSLGQRLARGETLIGLGLGIGGVGMVAGKLGLRIATKRGLTAVTAKALARGLKKGTINSKTAIRNIKFQTDVAKAARKSQKTTKAGGAAAKETPKEPEKVVDEAIDGMNENPAGYTSKARSILDDIKKYEEKFAKGTPRQRGGYRRHINKLRESLFQEIIKQPSFTRRVLAAPAEAARVSGFTFRAGSRMAASSIKAGVYRRRWLLGGTGAVGGVGLTVDAAINSSEITKNAWRDARDIATGLPYALYTSGKAGVAAVGGDWSYVNAMWDTYKDTSPILLGIQRRWDEALESLKRRPVSAALEVGGLYALAGRTASRIGQGGGSLAGYKPTLNPAEIADQMNNAGRLGRVGIRMGVASQRLRAPDIFMVNSPGTRQRRYSKNLLTAMIEKRADKNRFAKENALIQRRVDVGRKKELESKKDDEFTDADEKELAELATVKDLTPKEEKALKRIEKEREAAMLLMVDEYVDNAVSTLSLARRKVISDLEESLVAIPSRVSKEVGPGAEKALRLMASGSLGGPKTAVASAERLLAKAIEQRRSMRRNDVAEEAINLHIEQLKEILRNKEYLTDPKMWDAVEELGKVMNPLEDELVETGLLLPQQREFAPWIHYAIDQMGAKALFKDKKVSWVVPEKNNLPGEMGEPGTVLSVKDIRAHAEASGFKGTPVFFSARELEGGPTGSSFDGSAPITYNESTLGKLIDGQRYDLSWEDVMRQAIGVKLNITRKNFYDNIVALWATGDLQGMTFGSAAQAMDYFKANRNNYEVEMAALPIPGSVKKLDEDSLREELMNSKKGPGDKVSDSEFEDFLRNPTADVTDIFTELINNNGKFNFEVRYALVPAQLIKRLQDHAKSDAALNRGFVGAMNWANREFKGGVLPFSVAWHTGNIADMGLRMFMDGVGPADAARGIKLAKYLEKNHPELYTRFLAEIGGGHLIDAKQSVLSRRDSGKPPSLNPLNAPFSSRQLADYDYRQLTAAQKIMYQVRVDQQLARKYRWAQRKAFGLGEFVEKNARFAVVGKQAKDLLEEMGYNWFDTMRLNGKMIEDLALGLDKQRNLQALGKATNKTLGDYTNMGPDMRLAVRTALPFGLWLRASARFMLTMPYRAPIKMAFFENVNRMTEAERRELGLYLLDDRQTVLPAYLQGSIPGGTEIDPRTGEIVNTFFRTQQYTSLGPFYDLSTLVDFVLPIWSGIDDPLSGVSWKGTELISTDGKPLTTWEKSGVMMTSLLETYLYPSQIFHKMLVGGTPADSSSLVPSVKKENWRWNPPWQTRKFMESIRQTFFPDAQRSYNIIGQGDYKKIVYEEARSTKDLFNPTGKKSLFNPFRPQQWTLDKNRQSGGRRSVLLGEREPAYGRYIKPDVQKKYGKRRKGGSGLLGTKPPSSGSGGSTLLGK